MTPGLLLPAGLLALAGVLVPLLIHLIRRSEMLVSDFAALRWLAAKARPRRRLRFDERLLLAVRLLLIASIAALLAQPTLTGWPAARDWLLVVPGVAVADLPTPDSEREVERRWLAPGLLPLSAPTPAAGPTSSLLRELDATLAPDSGITVLVPVELAGLDGERPRLSRAVDWRVLDTDAGAAPDTPAARPFGADALSLWLAFAPERAAELRYLRAAAASSAPASVHTGVDAAEADFAADSQGLAISGEIALPDALDTVDWPAFGADWLIWLSDDPLPSAVTDWVAAGGQVLRIGTALDAANGEPVTLWRGTHPTRALRASALGSGRVLALNAPLTPERLPELLDPGFPNLLRSWLAEAGPMPSLAPAESHAPDVGLPAYPPPARGLSEWLAVLIALLFLVERWLASAPGRLR
jgi:hypothetical protein